MNPLSGRLRLILSLATLTLTGCITPSSPTVAPSHVQTAATLPTATLPAADLPPASITGSEEASTMLDNFTVFVTAVDGVPVTAGRDGWNTPLTLKAGRHRLTVGFIRGVFSATADLELTAVSKASYQVRYATDAELFGKNSYCEFWIVDTATNQPVGPRVRSTLTRSGPAK